MSDFKLQQLNKQEARKAYWGCVFLTISLIEFWSGIIYWAVNIYLN